MPMGAAEGDSSAGGMLQNNDRDDIAAAAPILMSPTDNSRWPWTSPNKKKQLALSTIVKPRCQRRSRCLSELRASRYIPARAPM
ncbi:hypothetical protein D3C80_1912630 [compost metagenome]